jgi:DNA polymerase-3 subunit epsilon
MVSPAWLQQEHQKAAQWAHDLLQGEFVIFDSETTGIGYDDELVQVGAIDQTGTVLLDSLVKPTRPITLKASAIHGLTAEHVAAAPGFPDVYPRLVSVLKGQRVVAYNADFDSRLLQQACWQYDRPIIEAPRWQCAMERYAQYHGQWNRSRRSFTWLSLTAACAKERIKVSGAHSAVGDCLLTLRLIQRIAAGLDSTP